MQNNKIKNETELLEMFTGGDGVRAFTYVPFRHPELTQIGLKNTTSLSKDAKR